MLWQQFGRRPCVRRCVFQDELTQLDRIGWIPVYLIPEASVLIGRLAVIRQLAGSQRFVFVIPSHTIRELDGMKKDSPDAREAIRFLETCFRQGNKYVRAQKVTEKVQNLANVTDTNVSE